MFAADDDPFLKLSFRTPAIGFCATRTFEIAAVLAEWAIPTPRFGIAVEIVPGSPPHKPRTCVKRPQLTVAMS
jgi:hypothetical protein